MHKLKLALDDLRVESFHAVQGLADAGTVVGHSGKPGCGSDSVCNTCPLSCAGSCDSCFETCVTCEYSCLCSGDFTICGCHTWETCPGFDICNSV
jgi:hypothetical protein